MTEQQPISPAPGINIADILYILFRHKWKLVLISAVGAIAALALPFVMPAPYESEAKLFIKYVLEQKSPTRAGANNSQIRSVDERGENIINTEIEILSSLDLAQQVATAIGPEKILGKGSGTNASLAAVLIRRNLVLDVPKKSNVIRVAFQHRDREIVQPVLKEIIDTYLKKHQEFHRTAAVSDEVLTQETDQIHSQLLEIEKELHKATTQAGVISIEDSKKIYSEQIAKIRQAILDAQAELAERQAAIGELTKLVPAKSAATTNATLATNLLTTATAIPTEKLGVYSDVTKELDGLNGRERELLRQGYKETHAVVQKLREQLRALSTQKAELERAYPDLKRLIVSGSGGNINAPAGSTNLQPGSIAVLATSVEAGGNDLTGTNDTAVSSEKTSEYKRVCGLLDSLSKREQDLLISFKPENSFVKQVRQQIAANEKVKKQLEDENPGLLSLKISDPKAVASDPTLSARNELAGERTRVTALQSKLKVLNEQLETLRKEASAVYEVEDSITELQRKRQLEEAHYKYFSESLANARIDERLGAGGIPNISKIQEASPPLRVPTKLYQIMAMILFGSVGSAFGLVFLIEFVLDRSIRRPAEIESRLGLPLFISLPLLGLNGKARKLKSGRGPVLLPQRVGEGPAQPKDGGDHTLPDMEIAPWDPKHALRPFYATLRDRLITYFEVNLLLHKPKLVAVTSCAEGVGVSTVAAGLAASLSETGDGNVLLVDMNQQNGAAQQFYKGDLGCGLDDALQVEKRDSALVQDNLYVVSETAANGQLPSILPRRFKSLVPKLKASDYDYIIFDLPPVSQISLTPRLARYMDMVLVVVESEKTDGDVVKRASALLRESQAKVGVVLNKSKSYVPKSLQQEL